VTLAPGVRIGPNEIVLRTGAGGMGELHEARDPGPIARRHQVPIAKADPERGPRQRPLQ